MFLPGQPICESCRKMVVKGAAKHADRMNRRSEMEELLADTLENPGSVDKDDPKYEYFVDNYDATAVWVDLGSKKKKR